MLKLETKFNSALQQEFPFLKLTGGSENEVSVFCVADHVKTQKHEKGD